MFGYEDEIVMPAGKQLPTPSSAAHAHGHYSRESNPDDTLRFYALRLHEVGMIKSNPQELVSRGTDMRFLMELRRELKA